MYHLSIEVCIRYLAPEGTTTKEPINQSSKHHDRIHFV